MLWTVRSLQEIAASFNLIPANSFPYTILFYLHGVNKTEKLDIEKVVFSMQK